jgi:hypothetical protein
MCAVPKNHFTAEAGENAVDIRMAVFWFRKAKRSL